MRNLAAVHGKPTRERYENPMEPKPHEANWFLWLGRQLTSRGIAVAIPAMPEPYEPVYEAWKAVFEAQNIPVDGQTGLVGHSAGAEFFLRWFSEDKDLRAERLVLVAPYRDYAGKHGEFSKYTLDTNIIKRIGELTIMWSGDDDEPIVRRAHELVAAFPDARPVEFEDYGHFRIGHNMTSEEFPELLEVLGVQ